MSNFSLEWPCSFGYKDFRFRRLFPVNGHYRDHFPTLFFRVFQGRLPQIGRCNFSAFSYGIRDGPINISGFVGNFRLPVVVEMPWEHLLLSLCGPKTRVCLSNFDDSCHTFGDISTSGL